MMGPSHRVAGVAAWLAVAETAGLTALPAAAGAVIAAATSHGRLSPDMDRYPFLGRVIPGGHRGITHWWPVLALFAVLLWTPAPWWIAGALATAWGSHILADAVFGRVPVWWARGKWECHGLGFKTGGPVELWLAVPVFTVVAVWLAWKIAT
ncbi:MAG TPA: metal-dependent hydrolase [Pseudonocardiaceae bacterium]|nr:metal-dependent hydrolase [Pseudonocardiaceae bacterium]